MAPVSPRQKSTSSWPSMVVTRAPDARSRNSGKPPAVLAIHVIGTPPNRWVASFAACWDRGFCSA